MMGLVVNLYILVFETDSAKISMRQLYDYAKRAANPSIEATRHGPKKAALELLTTHAVLFGSFFYQEYKVSVFKMLPHWVRYQCFDFADIIRLFSTTGDEDRSGSQVRGTQRLGSSDTTGEKAFCRSHAGFDSTFAY